jgi:hypothetical protein
VELVIPSGIEAHASAWHIDGGRSIGLPGDEAIRQGVVGGGEDALKKTSATRNGGSPSPSPGCSHGDELVDEEPVPLVSELVGPRSDR